MKHLLLAGATLLMALSCAQNKSAKILVLYYSQNGSTQAVAQQISTLLGADMEAIVVQDPYNGNFQETIERCLKEKAEGILPEIQPLSAKIQDYDIIFLGYPVWFGTYAPPVAALLEQVDLSGKKVVPFCSFGSGGLDSSSRDLAQKQPGAQILPGYGVRTARLDAVPAELDHFLKESGFLEGEYEKYPDFSEVRLVSAEEAALFDAAVAGYPMINAQAQKVSSRSVPQGNEYLFEAEDLSAPATPHIIKVYVLAMEGQEPVFTQVLR
jgi:flavodoxin